MCSTPPASATSQAPSAISPAIAVTAVRAPAHIRSTAKPGTDSGSPESNATSRPSARPWSPTWAVAASATSPIRSGGSWRVRRSSSRTTLTAMSSARVRQNIPFGPARPKAVRTPSTYTTSRNALPTRRAYSEAVGDWEATLEREAARYADGEARLPDAADDDQRQRQLTRLGNAAYGAGLCALMLGDGDAAREWLGLAAARWRESSASAPPGSWGRPIGAVKAYLLAGDQEAAEDAARWTLESAAAEAES